MITDIAHAKRLRSLVHSALGDNMERSNAAFGGLSEAQLDQMHGQSGFTRRQIWDEYKNERENGKALVAFVERLLVRSGL